MTRGPEAGDREGVWTPLLVATGLVKHFPLRRGAFRREVASIRAVDGVSIRIGRSETLGLVGESGCGKTTLGRTVLRLVEPTAGEVLFGGVRVFELGGSALRRMRRRMQMVFQDPYSSLDPRLSAGAIVGEGLAVQGLGRAGERRDRVRDLMARVGLSPDWVDRLPHEFSGGERQRLGIARALAVEPELIVCDEAVSALDVSVRAQILNLLGELREELGLAYLFISHDLSVVRHLSDRVAVMYAGRIVEEGPVRELFDGPLHPYTKALLSAVPAPDPAGRRERIVLEGDVPDPASPPAGCRFHPRCPWAVADCARIEPPLREYGRDHRAACLRIEERGLAREGES